MPTGDKIIFFFSCVYPYTERISSKAPIYTKEIEGSA
jgi:hypothetical protein